MFACLSGHHVYAVPVEARKEGLRSLRTGVTEHCEQPSVDVKSQTLVLCKNSKCVSTLSSFSSLIKNIFRYLVTV